MVLAKRSEIHFPRRLWHMFSGIIMLIFYFLTDYSTLVYAFIALTIALLGFGFDLYRLKNQRLNQKLTQYFGPILRRSELISFSGLPFYALGVALSFFLYRPEIAVLSILYLVFSDPIASVVGVYWGKDPLFPHKTLQGTLASFCSSFIITIIYMHFMHWNPPYFFLWAVLAATAGTFAELLSTFNIDDNLTIPVVSGFFLSFLF